MLFSLLKCVEKIRARNNCNFSSVSPFIIIEELCLETLFEKLSMKINHSNQVYRFSEKKTKYQSRFFSKYPKMYFSPHFNKRYAYEI